MDTLVKCIRKLSSLINLHSSLLEYVVLVVAICCGESACGVLFLRALCLGRGLVERVVRVGVVVALSVACQVPVVRTQN